MLMANFRTPKDGLITLLGAVVHWIICLFLSQSSWSSFLPPFPSPLQRFSFCVSNGPANQMFTSNLSECACLNISLVVKYHADLHVTRQLNLVLATLAPCFSMAITIPDPIVPVPPATSTRAPEMY